jgi:DNA-binding transcriptional ArsR family regulator
LVAAVERGGKHGVLAYGIAGTVDLLAVAAAVELADRHRRGVRRWDALAVLLLSVVATIAGQLVTAPPTLLGRCVALWPAVAFLSVAALIEFRPRDSVPAAGNVEPLVAVISTGIEPLHSVPTTRKAGAVAVEILAALEIADEPLSVSDVVERTGRARTSVTYQLDRLSETGRIIVDDDGIRIGCVA